MPPTFNSLFFLMDGSLGKQKERFYLRMLLSLRCGGVLDPPPFALVQIEWFPPAVENSTARLLSGTALAVLEPPAQADNMLFQ